MGMRLAPRMVRAFLPVASFDIPNAFVFVFLELHAQQSILRNPLSTFGPKKCRYLHFLGVVRVDS